MRLARWKKEFEAEWRRRLQKDKDRHVVDVAHEVNSLGHWFRARCSCGWFSDGYAMMSDVERAIEVHERRVEREKMKVRAV